LHCCSTVGNQNGGEVKSKTAKGEGDERGIEREGKGEIFVDLCTEESIKLPCVIGK
jgi:hypothetical protein